MRIDAKKYHAPFEDEPNYKVTFETADEAEALTLIQSFRESAAMQEMLSIARHTKCGAEHNYQQCLHTPGQSCSEDKAFLLEQAARMFQWAFQLEDELGFIRPSTTSTDQMWYTRDSNGKYPDGCTSAIEHARCIRTVED